MSEAASFWEVHSVLRGFFLCIMCAFLPRLTLFFLSLITGAIGVTFWGVVGWIFVPRIVVAVIATTIYWDTNPFLCVLAWTCALAGESTEKETVRRRNSSNQTIHIIGMTLPDHLDSLESRWSFLLVRLPWVEPHSQRQETTPRSLRIIQNTGRSYTTSASRRSFSKHLGRTNKNASLRQRES